MRTLAGQVQTHIGVLTACATGPSLILHVDPHLGWNLEVGGQDFILVDGEENRRWNRLGTKAPNSQCIFHYPIRLLTNHKFKDTIVKNFTMTTTEH